MAREDLLLAPESLEALISGFADLEQALGAQASVPLKGVKERLERAVALRQDGQTEAAVGEIMAAMQGIAEIAMSLDPGEAQAMQALAANFQQAMVGGQPARAAESVDSMRQKSGAQKKRGDEFKL